ncbi:RagB/SusD family nutrient uptake outer membrane protein [Prevotella sp. 10(H)]|uniref:RagB/SusD family nutrient uptake outer membrane protein n=1 Tax=Prevotella sp. 10(H) TaxID=1158294 RepID=UPI0004A745B1|nr:RagB/SusD family nutrient uptake outer membrane protein [Prevotella sp. 10(H)]
MKKNLFKSLYITAAVCLLSSCSESWLDPEPLSFYEPDITFTTREGLEASLTTCTRQIRYYWFEQGSGFSSEMIFSDMFVTAISDLSGAQDWVTQLTPISNNYWFGSNMSGWFYNIGYQGIAFANTVISRLPDLEMDQSVKEQMLSRAYFQRAWRYYHLMFQFGDIPLVSKEVTSPKLDFRSTKMELIVDQMVKDLEYAVDHIALRDDYGKENKGACLMLLIKFYIADGQFDKAINAANILINDCGYELMEEPFGTFDNPFPDDNPVTRNVIWDLHRPVNKSIPPNKESIMTMVNRYDNEESRMNTLLLNNFTPFWSMADANRGILTPSKSNLGMSKRAGTPEMMTQYPGYMDYREIFGTGEAFARPTYFTENGMWTDKNDLRHSKETGNWFVMENLKYNNVDLVGTADEQYYMKPIQKFADDGTLLCRDSIRCWFDFPYYKLWVEDIDRKVSNGYTGTQYIGGPGDMYLYRLAEAYLLRAEAYYWAKNYAKAAEDVNTIRKRAKCTTFFNASDLSGLDGLDVIMDERGRELLYEEFRHIELVRVSFIKANEEGTYQSPKSLADESSNSYWWHRITKYNNYYNKGVQTLHGDEYRMGKHNIFWPITQSYIDANLNGRINQNYGYSGYGNNQPPISTFDELAAADQ